METLSMFCAQCGGETLSHGRLAVTRCPDGRWLLRLETGRKGGAWLELMPADAAWLAAVLAQQPAD
jgi:hypothetical protein